MNIVEYIRQRLRSWLGIPDPADFIKPEKGVGIHHSVLRAAGERNVVYREFKAPSLMPGVVPSALPTDDPAHLGSYVALDSEFVAPTYAYANNAHCGLGFPGYAYLAELSQRSEYRAPSETIASEMTREFCKIISKGKATAGNKDTDGDGDKDSDDKIEQLVEALETFKVRDHLCKVAELDGQFGRGQMYVDIDYGTRDQDETDQLPLLVDSATIKKGSLKGFKVIEPIWTTPFSYNATDPRKEDFYKPKAWFVLGKRVHHTRLLTFIMREVPDILKPAYNFGGLSMTQLMESSVFKWLRTSNSISDLIHNFSVMVLKTDMTDILSGKPDKPGGLMDRAALFIAGRDNQGLTVLDMAKEDLGAVNVPLAGLDKLQAQSQEQQAAPCHIPLVKLLGVTPTGLNASSEGEIKVFYDFVRACQQKFFNENLNIILQILQLHLFGEIDDAISFEWVSLTAPTVKELSEIRKSNAETDAIYIDKGVISPDETRKKVNADPDSGYSNLSGDAPTPPDIEGMETQHDLGEKSAETAHERGEESAEADHKRQMKESKEPRAA